jgi:hypothetical protein
MVHDVRQTEIHTAKTLVPEPRAFEVDMAIKERKRHKSQGTDQLSVQLIQVRSRRIRSEVHKLIYHIRNKGELHEQWKTSVALPIYKKGVKLDCSNHFCPTHTQF